MITHAMKKNYAPKKILHGDVLAKTMNEKKSAFLVAHQQLRDYHHVPCVGRHDFCNFPSFSASNYWRLAMRAPRWWKIENGAIVSFFTKINGSYFDTTVNCRQTSRCPWSVPYVTLNIVTGLIYDISAPKMRELIKGIMLSKNPLE